MPKRTDISSILIIGTSSPSPAGRVGEGERRGAARPNLLAWRTPTRSRSASRLPLKGEGRKMEGLVVVAGDIQVAEDVFQYPFGVGQDVVVPIADHLIAIRFDDRGPFRVGGAVGMLPAVEFDGDARGAFGEVDDEAANGELRGEFVPAELFAAQMLPEAGFRVGRFATEFSGDCGQFFARHLSLLPSGEEVGGGGARRRVGARRLDAVHPHPTLPLEGEGFFFVRAHTEHFNGKPSVRHAQTH